MKIKVAALTTGRYDPSARFRIRQHIPPLIAEGVDVQEYIPLIDKHAGLPSAIADRTPGFLVSTMELSWLCCKGAARLPGIVGANSADIIWLNRELLPGRYTLERFLRKPLVLDVDDAVWRGRPDGPRTMEILGRRASGIFAGNLTIAEWFSSHSDNIHIIPTAIDSDRFKPVDELTPVDRSFRVGWTGTSGNFGYLYSIEEPLQEFLAQFNARLIIVAEAPPKFSRVDPERVEFVRWSPEVESSALQSMDVGLMPLPDTEWARGKCAFKMLQYMSTGLPVVVSPVGMNSELLAREKIGFGATTGADWYDALVWLQRNRDEARTMGAAGRKMVLERYCGKVVSKLISAGFQTIKSRL